MRIYVSNLAADTTHDDIRAAFSPYGQVFRVGLARDKGPRGLGLVEMANDNEAEAAIAELNGKQIGERKVKVRQAGRRPQQ